MDPSVGVAEDANLQRWVLGKERVLVRAAAAAVGADALQALIEHFKRLKQWLEAAKVEWAVAALGGGRGRGETYTARGAGALALIEEHALRSEEAQQLELEVLLSQAFTLRGPEQKRLSKRVAELLAGNEGLKVADKVGLAIALHYPKMYACFGADPKVWDAGTVVSEQSILEGVRTVANQVAPVWEQAAAESVGARQEVARMTFSIATPVMSFSYAGFSEQAATMNHEWAKQHWGPNASKFVEAVAPYSVARHLEIFRSLAYKFDCFVVFAHQAAAMGVYGDARVGVHLFTKQQNAVHDYARAAPPPALDVAMHFFFIPGYVIGREMGDIHGFRPAIARLLAAFGCTSPAACVRWYQESQDWSLLRKREKSSKDLRHHTHPADGYKSLLPALVTLAHNVSASYKTSLTVKKSINQAWNIIQST